MGTMAEQDAARRLVRVDEAAIMLGTSRNRIYRLINSGDQVSVKIGYSRRIPVVAIDDYIDRLRADKV